jgi:endonuclease/exonuclease/phosphatase family metal-dependent hydrolase
MLRRLAVVLLVLVALPLGSVSCLTTKNFKEPDGPRYEGSYAPHPAAAAAAQVESPLPAAPFRVVTFNVAFAKHVDGAIRLLQGTEVLRAPDVLLLQEMDSPGVEQIARALSLNYIYFPSAIHPMAHREFGTAILSPWTLSEYRKITLPHAAFGTRVVRSVTSAVLQYGTLRIRVYAVHLPAPGAISEDERKEQVQIIASDAAKSGDAVIIGGDFNGRVVGPWFTDAGFRWITDKLPGTSSALGLGFHWRYDHVFTRGLEAVSGGPASGVVDPAGASDHRAVWALLTLAR